MNTYVWHKHKKSNTETDQPKIWLNEISETTASTTKFEQTIISQKRKEKKTDNQIEQQQQKIMSKSVQKLLLSKFDYLAMIYRYNLFLEFHHSWLF